jgi:hypothetical protein
MSVTEAADALVLVATIAASIDNIDVISVQDLTGEIFRKVPTDIEVVTATKKKYTFWLDENEGNGSIVGLSLYGNGATATLGTGTELTEQAVTIEKDDTNSLTVVWEVEVTQ